MIVLGYLLEAALCGAAYGAIYTAWWRFIKRRRDAAECGESFHFLLAATLMWTQIYGVVFLLGLLKILDRSLVLVINAAITLFLLGVTRNTTAQAVLFAVIRRRAGEIF